MTDKEIERILKYIADAESSIDSARSEIEDLKNTIKVSEEVENFLYDLQDNEAIPEDIQDKAGELWKKI